MADTIQTPSAKEIYKLICDALDERKWHYEKDDEENAVYVGVSGEDLPIKLIMLADEKRKLIRMLSPLPFKMSEDKRMEGALATTAVNYGMADGSFDYNISDGTIVFRITATYRESRIDTELIQYLIAVTVTMVEKYNDKFFAINKGMLSISDFLEQR